MNLKSKNKVLYVICGLLLILVFSGGLLFFEQLKDNDIKLDEVKLRNSNNDSGMFAIMLEQEDGTFIESTSNTWPDGYTYNEEKSGCIDGEGNALENVLSYDSTNKKASVRTNKTAYCYLYFDQIPPSIEINITTDIPSTLGYTKNISCGTGTENLVNWNYKYNRLEFNNVISNNTKCNLSYVKDETDYPTLKSIVEASATTNANGYRYSGENPNNYIWFNNELWRIIGSIPTKLSDGSTTNLVKIIRNDSIGALAYEGRTSGYTGAWGSNTLYKLLNPVSGDTSSGIYFNSGNGIGNAYCVGYASSSYMSYAKCDYRDIGLGGTSSYYGSMVENVYWNTGASSNAVTAGTAYTNEIATQTVLGYVGLMSASDYGYAASSDYHSTNLRDYHSTLINDENAATNNWLFNNGYEWTSIQHSSVYYALNVYHDGSVDSYDPPDDYAVRPVLYLVSSVFVINGEEENVGSISNPYQIAMR